MKNQPFNDDVIAAAEGVGSAAQELLGLFYSDRNIHLRVRTRVYTNGEVGKMALIEVWDDHLDERINTIQVAL